MKRVINDRFKTIAVFVILLSAFVLRIYRINVLWVIVMTRVEMLRWFEIYGIRVGESWLNNAII